MINTKHKLLAARFLSALVVNGRKLFGRTDQVTVRRGGINWALDLKEGIDLSVYLFAGFEKDALRAYPDHVRPGSIVIDIGANIGAHTLPLAKLAGPSGTVFAIEPTQFAFAKLSRNCALNPELAKTIVLCQMAMTAEDKAGLPDEIYSSWPLDGSPQVHPNHRGRLMQTTGASPSTLDQFAKSHGLTRVDFVKLDVDGHERDVLFGGTGFLKAFKPVLMMELAPHVYESSPAHFDEAVQLLWDLGYQLKDLASGKIIPNNLRIVRSLIPPLGSVNVLAIPAA